MAGMPELQEQIPAGHPGAKGHGHRHPGPVLPASVENAHCLP